MFSKGGVRGLGGRSRLPGTPKNCAHIAHGEVNNIYEWFSWKIRERDWNTFFFSIAAELTRRRNPHAETCVTYVSETQVSGNASHAKIIRMPSIPLDLEANSAALMNPKIKILFKSRFFDENHKIHSLKMHYQRRHIKCPVFWIILRHQTKNEKQLIIQEKLWNTHKKSGISLPFRCPFLPKNFDQNKVFLIQKIFCLGKNIFLKTIIIYFFNCR